MPDSSVPSTDMEPTADAVETPVSRRPGLLDDVVVRRLTLASLGLLVLWLGGIVSALIFGLITPPESPRTSVERALMVYEAEVAAGATDPRMWADYAAALVTAGQYAKAEQIITQGLKAASEGRSLIAVERARLAFERERFSEAIELADETIALAEAEVKAVKEGRVAAGQPAVEPDAPPSLGRAILIKAKAYREMDDLSAAIAQYDEYLDRWPTAANIYVERARLKAETGDLAGAEADYRFALTYVPDYPDAFEGLDAIGADRP